MEPLLKNIFFKEEIMKKTAQLFLIGALVGLWAMPGLVYAQEAPGMTQDRPQMMEKKKERREQFRAKMQEKLGLSAEQEQKLKDYRKAHRQEIKQYFESKKTLRDQLKAELEKPELDLTQVHAIHDQLKALDNKIEDSRLASILEVRQILTPEQFKTFLQFKNHRKGQWGKMHRDKSR